MGWFSKDYNSMTDYEVGLDAIKIYLDVSNNATNINVILENYESTHTYLDGQIKGIGLGLKTVGLDDGDVVDAMEVLSASLNGAIPENVSQFRSAISGEAIQTNALIDFGAETQESLKEITTENETLNEFSKWPKYIAISVGVIGGIYVISGTKNFVKFLKEMK